MQPAQIRVFDGLRLTTEHLQHMQAALRSGVQDLREIMGLGVVYRGFEVAPSGDTAITVQPGLAFDFQRNRLVLDEPQTVQVTIGSDDAQFVCLTYDQIEDGQVEGQWTLIWDSCTIVLRPTLPGDDENLLPIAIVSRSADASLVVTSWPIEQEEPEATDERPTPNGDQINGDQPAAHTDGSSDAATSTATNALTTATQPDSNGATATETPPEPAPPTAITLPSQPMWSIRQGVERIAATNGAAIDPGALLIGPLRNRLAGTDRRTGDLRFTLHEAEVSTAMAVLSLTTHALLAATIAPADAPPLHLSATAHGEAAWNDAGVAQWSIVTIEAHAGETTPTRSSDLTERGVAHLPLSGSTTGAAPGTIEEVWQQLQIVWRIERGAADGFKLICHLVWIGAVNEGLIDTLQRSKPTLQWNGTLAWKAIGQASGISSV